MLLRASRSFHSTVHSDTSKACCPVMPCLSCFSINYYVTDISFVLPCSTNALQECLCMIPNFFSDLIYMVCLIRTPALVFISLTDLALINKPWTRSQWEVSRGKILSFFCNNIAFCWIILSSRHKDTLKNHSHPDFIYILDKRNLLDAQEVMKPL